MQLYERQYSEWSSFKKAVQERGLQLQFKESDEGYSVWGYDGPELLSTLLYKNPAPPGTLGNDPVAQQAIYDAERADFEANYKPYSNKAVVPRAADGKPFTLPNIFPGEVLLNFTGASDAATVRFTGDLFQLQKAGAGDATFDINLLDGVFLAGGHVEWDGGSWGSSVTMTLEAPASTVKDPAVPGQGNCNLVPTPYGFNMIVPAAGNGTKDLDVATPVPASDDETNVYTGYWSHSEPWVGKGVVTPGTPGASKYNLFDAPLKMATFTRLPLMRDTGARDLASHAIKPKWVLPEWTMRVTIHNEDSNKTLRVAWDLLVARRKS